MPSFNLIDQPWIPVLDEAGTLHEVGILDALLKAHEWREVYTDSPMQTAALCRLLLALRLAIFPETLSKDSDEAWLALWKEERFPEDPVRDYLNKHRRRFDLFDEEYPFYQDTTLSKAKLAKPKKGDSLEQSIAQTKMFVEETGSAILFNHTFHSEERAVGLNNLARGLLSLHLAGPSDGQSKQLKDEARIPGKSPGVLMNSAMFWVRGATLFEALMLNAPPDLGIHPVDDRPNWERSESLDSSKTGRAVRGPLDYLTWQTRRVILCPVDDGKTENNNEVIVREARMVQGETIKYERSEMDGVRPVDPMMVLRGGSSKPDYYRFEKGRALWRDAHVFLKLLDKSAKRLPRSFEWLQNQHGKLKRMKWNVDVFGIRTDGDPGRFALWRHERMPLHVAYLDLDNSELRDDLRDCLDYAECMGRSEEKEQKNYRDREKHIRCLAERLFIRTKDKGKTILIRSLLYDACFRFSRLLRFPETPPNPRSESRFSGPLSKEQIQDAEAFTESLQPETHFWPALEAPFYKLLDDLAAAYEQFDETRINEVKDEWRRTVRRTARSAFRETVKSFAHDARTLRAIVSAEAVLYYGNQPPAMSDQPKPERLL